MMLLLFYLNIDVGSSQAGAKQLAGTSVAALVI
jgi:hypothetical protein